MALRRVLTACLLACILTLTLILHACAAATEQEDSSAKIAGSRAYPVPMLQTAYFNGLFTWSDPYVLALSLTRVVRGDEAWAMVHAANSLNCAPPDGMEYILFQFHAEAVAARSDVMIDLHPACFSLFGQDGTAYDKQVSIADLGPALGGMYRGAMRDGYAYFLVSTFEKYPSVVFLPGVNDGLWFSSDPAATLPGDTLSAMPKDVNTIIDEAVVEGSRALPYAPQQTALFEYASPSFGSYSASIMLNSVVRGKKALRLVDKADAFHSDPPDGQEYMFADFTITLHYSQDGQPVDFPSPDFVLVSESGNVYIDHFVVDDYENTFDALKPGETRTGSLVFLIDERDTAPCIVYLPTVGSGLWFSAQ